MSGVRHQDLSIWGRSPGDWLGLLFEGKTPLFEMHVFGRDKLLQVFNVACYRGQEQDPLSCSTNYIKSRVFHGPNR